jgi:hypothetical protein
MVRLLRVHESEGIGIENGIRKKVEWKARLESIEEISDVGSEGDCGVRYKRGGRIHVPPALRLL